MKYLHDVLIILGVLMLGIGLWMLYPWLSLTVVGVLITAFGLLLAKNK